MADPERVYLLTQNENHIFFYSRVPDNVPIQPHVYSKKFKFSKWRNEQNVSDSEDKWPSGLPFRSVSLLDLYSSEK